MRRNTVGVVWAVGLLLALGLYLAGPDRFGTVLVEDFSELC
jgi:hypothetical protein